MSTERSRPDEPEPALASALIDACSDGIIVYDAVGTVLWHNDTARQLVGVETGELLGTNGTDYIHPEDVETARQRWIEMLGEPGKTVAVEQRIVSVDGATRWCDTRMQNRLDDPAVGGVICYFHDITELREAEEALRLTHKQDVVGLLAGQMAHDFNNLLTAILGHADLALLQLPAGDTTNHERIRIVRQAAEQAAVLTGRMLTFSRKHLTHRKGVDLVALITRQVPILQQLVSEHIVLEFAGELSPEGRDHASLAHGWVDEHQFEQVLLNLVANAGDAIGPGPGRITVAVDTVTLDAQEITDPECPPGEYTVIRVTDTGEGVPAELLPNLFEPFVTTKAPGEGTGLGLSIVADIVSESRGFLTIDSEIGVGTTVKVHVPRYFGDLGEQVHEPGQAADLFGEGGVMVVDDDLAVLSFVESTLTTLGYDVYTASTHDQALQVFADNVESIDLCLLDSVLPGESGQSLAREFARTASIPIVMMSGYVRDPTDDLPETVTALLNKPFGVQRLAETVMVGIGAGSAASTDTHGQDPAP